MDDLDKKKEKILWLPALDWVGDWPAVSTSETLTWSETEPEEVEVWASKFDCWSKDTSWSNFSWDKPVFRLFTKPLVLLVNEGAALFSKEDAFAEECCLLMLGWPCFL